MMMMKLRFKSEKVVPTNDLRNVTFSCVLYEPPDTNKYMARMETNLVYNKTSRFLRLDLTCYSMIFSITHSTLWPGYAGKTTMNFTRAYLVALLQQHAGHVADVD